MNDKKQAKVTREDLKRWRNDCSAFVEEVIFEGKFKLTPYQREWAELLKDHRRLSFMAFRSSGKSEFFFVCYPIWKAITEPGWQGLIVSNSEEQAKSLIKRIKSYIQRNKILSALAKPDSTTDSWSKTELTFRLGSSIKSKPYNENIRGYHVDFVGLDEVGTYRDHLIFKEVVIPTLREPIEYDN